MQQRIVKVRPKLTSQQSDSQKRKGKAERNKRARGLRAGRYFSEGGSSFPFGQDRLRLTYALTELNVRRSHERWSVDLVFGIFMFHALIEVTMGGEMFGRWESVTKVKSGRL